MIWLSVSQETAKVQYAPTNKWATGIGHTDTCIRLSAHYRFLKFAPDVVACVAVTVS
jgi:hypothetical protein